MVDLVRGIRGDSILPNLTELYLSNVSVIRMDFWINTVFHEEVKNKPLKVLDISNVKTLEFGLIKHVFTDLEILNILNKKKKKRPMHFSMHFSKSTLF